MILYGALPRRGTVLAGLPAPRPDIGKRIICEALPRAPTVRELYMGLRPMPHLGIFFGKKIPKNPKKPNRIRYRLSSIDSEQGCRRQPCFLFSANCSYCFSDEVEKLKVCSFKKQQRNKTKRARLSSLLLLSMGAALFTLASEMSIVSENHAKVNSPNLSGLEHSF